MTLSPEDAFELMDPAFAQLYIQVIFSVRHRAPLIIEACRSGLERNFCEVISRKGSRPLAVYCHTDHVHLLIQWNPAVSVCELVHAVKDGSNRYLSEEGGSPLGIEWQSGFTAFSYSRCDIDRVVRHILNQPLMHATVSYQAELTRMLQGRQLGPDARYLMEWYS